MLGEINIELDKLGRAKKVIDYKGRETKYKLGAFGERLELEYPDGKKVKYSYDDEFNLIKLVSNSEEISYSYDEYGRLIRKDMPEEISSIYTYNERGLLESLTHLQKERKLEKYSYLYDLAGNKISISRKRSVQVDIDVENPEKIEEKLWEDTGTFNYEYDKLNRLISVKKDSRKLHSYSYDAFGNRSKMKKDGMEVAYTYDALDRLVKTGGLYENKTYEYDKRGNLTGINERGKRIKSYEYGASGRLSLSYSNSGNVRSYEYDGMGNRVGFREYGSERKGFGESGLEGIDELKLPESSPVYEERYVLDRTKPYNNMLQRSILDRGKEQTQSYAWDFNAVFMEEEEKVYTYLNDELGSTIRLLEKEGKSQTIYGYDEFGKDTYGTQGQV